MKKSTFIILGLMILSLGKSAFAQGTETLIRVIEGFNHLPNGGSTPDQTALIDKRSDTLSIGGWMGDSLWIYDTKGRTIAQKLYNIPYMVQQLPDGSWGNGPPMVSSSVGIVAHPPPINGTQYISCQATPLAQVLVNGTYVPLTGINFTDGYFDNAFDRKNNEVLFVGKNGNGSFLTFNGVNFGFSVIWNTKTNVLTHTFSTIGEGIPWNIGSFATGDSVLVGTDPLRDGNFHVLILGPNTNQWTEPYPVLPCIRALKMNIINHNIYVVVELQSGALELHKLLNGVWKKLLDLNPKAPYQNYPNPISGLEYYKGKIIVAGNFDKANNQSVSGLITFDETSGTIANLVASLPSLWNNSMNHCSGIYRADTALYIASRRGSVGVGLNSQTVYILRDTTSIAPPPNLPPVAHAGVDQTITLPTNSVTLNGSGTDPDGTIAKYSWARLSGSGTIATPASASTVVSSLSVGTSTYRLTVTDNSGATASDDVTISVNAAPPPPNQPPVAHAGVDQTITLPTNSVTLNGSGTDPDGTIAKYAWTKKSGATTATIGTASSATTLITNLFAGTYTFTLTVTDNNGATASDDVTISVNADREAPPPKDSVKRRIYPDPATTDINIYPATLSEIIGIYDILGRRLSLPSTPYKKGENVVGIVLPPTFQGMYVLRGRGSDGKMFAIKFMVVH